MRPLFFRSATSSPQASLGRLPPAVTGCAVLRDGDPLGRAADAWRGLLAESDVDGPMLSPAWAASWWEVFGALDGRALRLVLVRDRGRLVGIAPLVARTHWYGGALPFRRLELVGTGEALADEVCSAYVGVIAARGAEPRVAAALADALDRGELGPWDEVLLRGMPAGSAMPRALASAFAARGWDVTLTPEADASVAVLAPTWEAWLASLPSRHRYGIKRALRDFERWSEGTGAVEVVTDEPTRARAMATLAELHEARWRGTAAGHGAFHSPRFRAFHARASTRLLADGALDLSVLSAFGEPVAALYALRWGARVVAYQTGRRTDLPDAVRPGIVMHAHAIRRAIDAGAREYDLLGGASPYKRTFAQTTRALVALRVARVGLREGVRRQALRAKAFLGGLRAHAPALGRGDDE